MSSLQELADLLEKAEGPIERHAAITMASLVFDDVERMLLVKALIGGLKSVGAALALVERVLPGWKLLLRETISEVTELTVGWHVEIEPKAWAYQPPWYEVDAPTLTLAILRTMVIVLIQKENNGG